MNKEQEMNFENFCIEFAKEYTICVGFDSTENYVKYFTNRRWSLCVEEFNRKYFRHSDDCLKESDKKYFKIYKDIMIKILSNRVEELKIKQLEKEKNKKKQ